MGIALITRSACKAGKCPKADLDEIISMLRRYSLPTECPFGAKEIAEIALGDKKRSGGSINLIVPHGIGNSKIEKTNIEDLEAIFAQGLQKG
jgi:3-dehydroquinate synthase